MRVKMFIGDLTDSLETAHHGWLAAGGRQILNGEVSRPFPFVRSAADVLMMPKDGLQDPSVRADVRHSLTHAPLSPAPPGLGLALAQAGPGGLTYALSNPAETLGIVSSFGICCLR